MTIEERVLCLLLYAFSIGGVVCGVLLQWSDNPSYRMVGWMYILLNSIYICLGTWMILEVRRNRGS